jgi:hypothetical protein
MLAYLLLALDAFSRGLVLGSEVPTERREEF